MDYLTIGGGPGYCRQSINFEDKLEVSERQSPKEKASGRASTKLKNQSKRKEAEDEPLVTGRSKTRFLRPADTARASPTSEGNHFVADIAYSPAAQLVATGLPDGRFSLHSVDQAGLQLQSSQKAHRSVVSNVSFLPGSQSCLCTASSDGLVCGWDLRSRQQTFRFDTEGSEVLAVNISSKQALLAAGTTQGVIFWDLRKSGKNGGNQVAAFADIHEKEVTKVAFHPQQPDKFLSSSIDGLISVFDLANGLDEDTSFIAALNLMDSAGSFGFYGRDFEQLWCRTFTERLYLWKWREACVEESAGGEAYHASFTDARAVLSGLACEAMPTGIAFLLDCTYDPSQDILRACGGTTSGDLVMCPILEYSETSSSFGQPLSLLQRGHCKDIRCHVWPREGQYACFTGGEDGQIVAWTEEESKEVHNTKREQKRLKLNPGTATRPDS